MQMHGMPLNDRTFLLFSLCCFRPFHYALKSKNLKPRTHRQHWCCSSARSVQLCVRAAVRWRRSPQHLRAVCVQGAVQGWQSGCVCVSAERRRPVLLLWHKGQTELAKYKPHVLKVPGLPVDDN